MSVRAETGPAIVAKPSRGPARRSRLATGSPSVSRPRLERSEPTTAVKVTARAIILLVIVLVMLTFAVAPFKTYLQQRAQLKDLEHRTGLLEHANRVLQGRLGRLNDPVYLERLARECLGLVKPGERAFVVAPRRGSPLTSDC